ncbi:TetR family transcriptional regulator [Conexibacter sp. CPCC 206217]|uniref:acyl-CoA-like ligand-binding transcription factor n=1 Tax=Conexibacter sp. CPCC 206217 TaxID=3064574 RepID=UPI00271725EE|nr:TetR family transcriptional regulator [Conexibacter sp. CPCC 206217]MDO8211913.1 TetR family transcriptional regulator [Conexibacter sp. CPCC 206217]
MASPSEIADRPMGLRERKKLRTRATIQQEALRLFRERGYAATTVDEIAAAAEVSQSTFFRYFPAKEDVVMYDSLDPLMITAFRAQPPELTPLAALRGALVELRRTLPREELERERERHLLASTVPELRARMLTSLTGTVELLAEMVAERTGRPVDDLALRTFAGALVGISLATIESMARGSVEDYFDTYSRALELLEQGLPL